MQPDNFDNHVLDEKGQEDIDQRPHLMDFNNDPLEDFDISARPWYEIVETFSFIGTTLIANPLVWPLLPHKEKLDAQFVPLHELNPNHVGECWIIFAYDKKNQEEKKGYYPVRTDGLVLPCQWRADVKGHDKRLPEALLKLADDVKKQLAPLTKNHNHPKKVDEFYLHLSEFNNSDLTELLKDVKALVDVKAKESQDKGSEDGAVGDVDSAWGALASGLYLAVEERVLTEWPFSSICYDPEKKSVKGVGWLEQKMSVILDFQPTHFLVSPEQACRGGEAELARQNLREKMENDIKILQSAYDENTDESQRDIIRKRQEIMGERLRTLNELKLVSPRHNQNPVRIAREIALGPKPIDLILIFKIVACLLVLLGLFGWYQFGYRTEYYQDYKDNNGRPVGLKAVEIPYFFKLTESFQYILNKKGNIKLPSCLVSNPGKNCYRFTYKGLNGLFGTPLVYEVVHIEENKSTIEYNNDNYVPYFVYYSGYHDENGVPIGQEEISSNQLMKFKDYYRFMYKGLTSKGLKRVNEISHIEEGVSTTEYCNDEYVAFNVYYADYMTKNSIPQGISRLTSRQVKNMCRHYVFSYKGCNMSGEKILRSVTICDSLGHPAELLNEIPIVYPLKRHSQCMFYYLDNGSLDKIKRYNSFGRHIDTLLFSIEQQDIVVTIQDIEDLNLKNSWEYLPKIEIFNGGVSENQKIKKLKLKRDGSGRLLSCWYFLADGKSLAIGEYGENGYQFVYENDNIKDIILLSEFENLSYRTTKQHGWHNHYKNDRLESQESLQQNLKNKEIKSISNYSFDYDQWGNCTSVVYHDGSGNVSHDRTGVFLTKIEYDSGFLKCIKYFDEKTNPTTKKIDYITSEGILEYSKITNIDNSIKFKPFDILDNLEKCTLLSLVRPAFNLHSHRIFHFFDSHGTIKQFENMKGIHKTIYKYDDNGRKKLICYYDSQDLGKPFIIEKIERTYVENHSVIPHTENIWPVEKMEIAFYEKDYQPIDVFSFKHKSVYNFNQMGKIDNILYFNKENVNVPYKKEIFSYDNNRLISKSNKTINGKNEELQETWEYEYLENDQISVIHSYLTQENPPQRIEKEGIGYEIIIYNENLKPISMKAYNVKGEKCLTNENFHEIRYHYDNLGFVDEISFFGLQPGQKVLCKANRVGINKNPFHCLKMTNDANGHVLEESYYDIENNVLLFQDTLGYARKTYNYDWTGRCIEEHYFDENNYSYTNKDFGYAGRKIENISEGKQWTYWRTDGNREIRFYNLKGHLISEKLFKPNGHLIKDKHGVAVYQYKYDDKGYRKQVRYYDTDEVTFVLCKHGIAGTDYMYNSKGLKIQSTNIGKDGRIKKDNDLVAAIHYEYDKNNFESKRYFLDEKLERTQSIDKIGGWKSKRDSQGRLMEKHNIDNQDKLIKNGIPIIKYQYSQSGNHKEERYYDIYDKRTVDNDGIGGFKWDYDDDGNEIERCKIDENDNLTMGKTSWAVCVTKYDKRGLKISEEYLNEKREKIDDAVINNKYKTGFIVMVNQNIINDDDIKYIAGKINNQNQPEELHLLNKEYICTDCIYGWAKKKREYNNDGELQKESFFNKNDVLVIAQDVGYSYITRKIIRENGKIIVTMQTFNQDDFAVKININNISLYGLRCIYEDTGQLMEIQFLDPTGKQTIINEETRISKISISFDSIGLCHEISYYDDNNKLTMYKLDNIAFSKIEIKYLQDDNCEISFYDKDMKCIEKENHNLKEYKNTMDFTDTILDKYFIVNKSITNFKPESM